MKREHKTESERVSWTRKKIEEYDLNIDSLIELRSTVATEQEIMFTLFFLMTTRNKLALSIFADDRSVMNMVESRKAVRKNS
jgi:hypothetical protein